jgi:ABC-type Zn2+ transport system substrate-binding protein/surface adhesin
MPSLPKSIATLACASLLATCPVLAGTAAAHPRHEHGTHQHADKHGTHRRAHEHTTHRHEHAHGKPADHLAGLRRGAAHAIAAQLKAVQRLVTEADALDLADEGALLDALGADRAAVQADLDAVGDVPSRGELHGLMTSANTSRHVAQLQLLVVAAADAAGAEAAALGQTLEALAAQVFDSPPSPDKAAAEAVLEDAMSLLATVTAQVGDSDNGVIGFVLDISPTASRAQLHAAAVAVHEALDSIVDALLQIEADIASLQV